MTNKMQGYEVPKGFEQWFGSVGARVTVRYAQPGHPVELIEGKLSKVASTGAWARISGVEQGDGSRRTVEYPIEWCTLLTKGQAARA